MILGAIVALRPAPPKVSAVPATPLRFAQVQSLVGQHCISCHGAQVQMKNVRLDSSDLIRQHAQNIYQQVVVTQQMPMGNATGLTQEDRAMFGRWFQAGAQLD
jgi:uncharacterized membrane protein